MMQDLGDKMKACNLGAPAQPQVAPPAMYPMYMYHPQAMAPIPMPQMEFSVEDTSTWIKQLCEMRGWTEEAKLYEESFRHHEIQGSAMQALTAKDLEKLSIKEEHREEVLGSIAQAFQNNQAYQQAYFASLSPMMPLPMMAQPPDGRRDSLRSTCSIASSVTPRCQGSPQLYVPTDDDRMSVVSLGSCYPLGADNMQTSDEEALLASCGTFEQAQLNSKRRQSYPQPMPVKKGPELDSPATPPGLDALPNPEDYTPAYVRAATPKDMASTALPDGFSGFGRTRVDGTPRKAPRRSSYASILSADSQTSAAETVSDRESTPRRAKQWKTVSRRKGKRRMMPKRLMPRPKN